MRVKSELDSKKPRKIMSGHAITEKRIESLMRDNKNEQRKTKTEKTVSRKGQNNTKKPRERSIKKNC